MRHRQGQARHRRGRGRYDDGRPSSPLTEGVISQQVCRLKNMFKYRLILRGNRSPRVTPAGERLFSRRMLNDEIQDEMSGAADGGRRSPCRPRTL